MKTIDADAHVIETPYTFEFMDESDRGHMPLVVGQTSAPTPRRSTAWSELSRPAIMPEWRLPAPHRQNRDHGPPPGG